MGSWGLGVLGSWGLGVLGSWGLGREFAECADTAFKHSTATQEEHMKPAGLSDCLFCIAYLYNATLKNLLLDVCLYHLQLAMLSLAMQATFEQQWYRHHL